MAGTLGLLGVEAPEVLSAAVETATGWPGLVVVGVYSFLVAVVLPGPSEIVLAAPLNLGLDRNAELAVILLVSGAAKAAGSVVALRLGHEVGESGPMLRFFRRRGVDLQA